VRVTPLPEAEPRARRVAVGTFDGVHLGHREVIRGADTVLTFEPHPLAVIHPEALPRLLDSFAIKRDLIASLGVEELVVIPFDREFAAKSAERFVEEVLVERLGATDVSVGENFRFGQRARGDAELLLGRPEFHTRVVPMVEAGGETVSSSHVRGLVAAGDVAEAAMFLGRPFLLEGEVVEGERRGRELGMPTANVVPDNRLACPGHGVYAAEAQIGGRARTAAVSVGVRPTFGTGRSVLVESHLLDYAGELYGETLRVAFLERIRGERRFESVSDLVRQMHDDVDRVREIASATVSRR
jgi:riboflavin kinase / FMN adenylyltransferase